MPKENLEELNQVAQLSSLLAVALDSGLSLVAALEFTFGRASGGVAARFQRVLASLDLGGNLHDELQKLRSKTSGSAVNDLAIKLQVSMQFGSPLAEQLTAFSQALRSRIDQQQFTQAAKKENLMLLPLVFLILPVTVIFAIFPAMQYLNINY